MRSWRARGGALLAGAALSVLVAGATPDPSTAEPQVEVEATLDGADEMAAPGQAPGPGVDPGAAGDDAPAGGRTGPDPSGQPRPDASQRTVDTLVWFGLLAALGVAVVLAVRLWWRSPTERPLLDEDRAPTADERRPPTV